MVIRILIVDDDPSMRETLRDTLEEEVDWKVEDQTFDGLTEVLERFRPDLLVLDLLRDQVPHAHAAGNASFQQIRNTWFCPVVVYSAFADLQDFKHPLVTTIKKGAETDVEVRDRLQGLVPHVRLIRSVHRYFDASIRGALRDSVGVLQTQIGMSEQEGVFVRAVRRLVAARADAETSESGKLRAWERFIVPPLGSHLLTADLLRRSGANWKEEEAYRLVLTPSCDLVLRSDGRGSADRILVSRCMPMEALGRVALRRGQTLNSSQRSTLRSILSEGMVGQQIPLPEFRDHVPLMVANLKELELLDWNQVDSQPNGPRELLQGERFERVASTDSPFREMVVWAYLRVTGRPGLPVIDIDDWVQNISDHFAGGGNS